MPSTPRRAARIPSLDPVAPMLTTADLLNYAERPRVGDWSLRSALVRFAQPEPEAAAELLRAVRRLDAVLPHHDKSPHPDELLALAARLDVLGDVLAQWAHVHDEAAPVDAVTATAAEVWARMDELGVPEEVSPGPPRRGRGART